MSDGIIERTITSRVIDIITKTQRLDPGVVTAESSFAELKIDSLDGINILFALENEFDINIPDEEARKIRTVAEMVAGVEQLVTDKG